MNIQKTPLILKVVSLYFVIALIFGSAIHANSRSIARRVNRTTNVDQPLKLERKFTISGSPVHIEIPRLGVSLDVTTGVYDAPSRQWLLSPDKVSFIGSSSLPNDTAGNTYMYGHNNVHVLYKTKYIQQGDELVIRTSNNHEFRYRYVSDFVTDPSDTSVLGKVSDKPSLTLQTCTGLLSQDRRLMYFDLVGVK